MRNHARREGEKRKVTYCTKEPTGPAKIIVGRERGRFQRVRGSPRVTKRAILHASELKGREIEGRGKPGTGGGVVR